MDSPVNTLQASKLALLSDAIEYAETWFAGDRVTLTVNHDGE